MRAILKWIPPLLGFIGASLMAGVIGGFATQSSVDDWYRTLEKPFFTPPDWLFGPVWTVLYILMGIAAFLVWREGWENPSVQWALALFAIQLVLNACWSVAFFGMESPLLGLIVIALLWTAIVWTMNAFSRHSVAAVWLMAPYIGWVTYAIALNAAIWYLN